MSEGSIAPDPPTKYLVALAIGCFVVGFASSYFNIAQDTLVWLMLVSPFLFGVGLILDALLVGLSDLDSGARELIYAIIGALVPVLGVIYWSRRNKLRRQYRNTHRSAALGDE